MIEIKEKDSTEWKEMDFSFLKECLFKIGFTFRGAFIEKTKVFEYALKYHGGLIWILIELCPDNDWLLVLSTYPTGRKKDKPSSEKATCRTLTSIIFEEPNSWILTSPNWESSIKLKV